MEVVHWSNSRASGTKSTSIPRAWSIYILNPFSILLREIKLSVWLAGCLHFKLGKKWFSIQIRISSVTDPPQWLSRIDSTPSTAGPRASEGKNGWLRVGGDVGVFPGACARACEAGWGDRVGLVISACGGVLTEHLWAPRAGAGRGAGGWGASGGGAGMEGRAIPLDGAGREYAHFTFGPGLRAARRAAMGDGDAMV